MDSQAGIAAKAAHDAKNTPMMEQYFKIKAEHADFLLFYRMGEFYELFFDDALIAAKVLDITLTARGRHNGENIPMCGVPVHTAEDYLQKLIAANYRIAVCEQMEDPAQARARGTKAVVRREVVRLVTPGTVTEEKLLAPERANYLMALVRAENTAGRQQPAAGNSLLPDETEQTAKALSYFALAWLDISTGIFRVSTCDNKRLLANILRVEPQELIIAATLYNDEKLRALLDIVGKAVSPQPDSLFATAQAEKRICAYYHVATLEGFADFSRAELQAIAAILAYVEKTQIHERPPLQRPALEDGSKQLFIDAATAANLELTRTLSGKHEGSLFKAVDRTLTGSGARLLLDRLTAPLNQVEDIEDRLDSVAFFLSEPGLRNSLREKLQGLADIMRALSRLALARGGPRDFAAVLHALKAARAIHHDFALADLPAELQQAIEALAALPDDWRKKLQAALDDDLPFFKRDGGFIRKGYNAELDELRSLKTETHRIIAAMQKDLALETDIKNLKIKHNNILGFFIEVTAAQAGVMTEAGAAESRFIHRQTMANAMRFTTAELADLENRINSAANGALAVELQIFEELTQDIKNYADDLRDGAAALAVLDVSSALAVLAEEQAYCRPVVDNSLKLAVQNGRHPVVEQALRRQADDPFIANNCDLSPVGKAAKTEQIKVDKAELSRQAGSIWLLTGPNMGGKSTFLRQNALIVLMAQMGSFVPAISAHIGLVDRLFSRVGASDDLARGRSTFMVEMVETATILNQAGEKSLVILDEIGRGTATFDGLSIAWAALEYLHNMNRCRAIFATHFHELTILAKTLPRLSNHTLKVREWQNEVIFLHEVAAGVADRSYGVQVAELAGLPEAVIARARAVLAQLENQALTSQAADILQDLPLFGAVTNNKAAKYGQTEPISAVATKADTSSASFAAAAIQDKAAGEGQAVTGTGELLPPAANKQPDSVPAPFIAAARVSGPGRETAATLPAAGNTNIGQQDSSPVNTAAGAIRQAGFTPAETALLTALAAIDPDSLTPRAALDELYRLKALLRTMRA